MTDTLAQKLTDTMRQFEEAARELIVAFATRHAECAAKKIEIDDMRSRLRAMTYGLPQRDHAAYDLKAAERKRADELLQASIDGRQPDTTKADNAIELAKERIAEIAAADIASKALAKQIGERVCRLALEARALELSLDEMPGVSKALAKLSDSVF